MLTRFIVQNFKAIGKRVEIDLRPITLLFGPNASGKSSVIHALNLAYCNLCLGDRYGSGKEAQAEFGTVLGDFSKLVHGYDESKHITLGFAENLTKDHEHENATMSGLYRFCNYTSLPAEHDPFLIAIFRLIHDFQLEWDIPLSEIRHEINGEPFAIQSGGSLKYLNLQHPIFAEIANISPELIPDSFRPYLTPDSPDWIRDLIRAIPSWDVGPVASDRVQFIHLNPLLLKRPDEFESRESYSDLQEPAAGRGLNLNLRFYQDRGSEDGMKLGSFLDPKDKIACALLTEVLTSTLAGTLKTSRSRIAGQYKYLGPLRTRSLSSQSGRATDGSREVVEAASYPMDEEIDVANDLLKSFGLPYEYRRIEGVNLVFEYAVDPPSDEDAPSPRMPNDPWIDLLNSPEADALSMEPQKLRDFWAAVKKQWGKGKKSPIRLALFDRRYHCEVPLEQVGTGISQVLPVAVVLGDGGFRVVSIEQPELHLHPRVQLALADLFIRKIPGLLYEDEGHFYFRRLALLETHSEHILLRFLRRIRETMEIFPDGRPTRSEFRKIRLTDLPEKHKEVLNNVWNLLPEDLSVIYFNQSKKDGEIRVLRLRVDEKGEFMDRWPDGFFEERGEELFG